MWLPAAKRTEQLSSSAVRVASPPTVRHLVVTRDARQDQKGVSIEPNNALKPGERALARMPQQPLLSQEELVAFFVHGTGGDLDLDLELEARMSVAWAKSVMSLFVSELPGPRRRAMLPTLYCRTGRVPALCIVVLLHTRFHSKETGRS